MNNNEFNKTTPGKTEAVIRAISESQDGDPLTRYLDSQGNVGWYYLQLPPEHMSFAQTVDLLLLKALTGDDTDGDLRYAVSQLQKAASASWRFDLAVKLLTGSVSTQETSGA